MFRRKQKRPDPEALAAREAMQEQVGRMYDAFLHEFNAARECEDAGEKALRLQHISNAIDQYIPGSKQGFREEAQTHAEGRHWPQNIAIVAACAAAAGGLAFFAGGAAIFVAGAAVAGAIMGVIPADIYEDRLDKKPIRHAEINHYLMHKDMFRALRQMQAAIQPMLEETLVKDVDAVMESDYYGHVRSSFPQLDEHFYHASKKNGKPFNPPKPEDVARNRRAKSFFAP